jgi:hypothetical protein
VGFHEVKFPLGAVCTDATVRGNPSGGVMETYTNKDLARDYFTVVALHADDISTYRRIRDAIAHCGIDLPGLYRETGNLAAARTPGIGQKTIPFLEEILRDGVEKVRTRVELIWETSGHAAELVFPGRRGNASTRGRNWERIDRRRS